MGLAWRDICKNSIIVLDKGEPSRLFIRDFGGIRILEERLKKQGMNISLYEGSAIRAKKTARICGTKTFYPVFFQKSFWRVDCMSRSVFRRIRGSALETGCSCLPEGILSFEER
ncbi:hypothetical protein GCM10020331_089730 [Ectobacillus funiculus]